MFRPLAHRTVRWRPVEGVGLEHLDIRSTASGIRASAVVVGNQGGTSFGARYRIFCDPAWRVLAFGLSTSDGRGLAMTSPKPGRWLDDDGRHIEALDGCVDIDLSATPFTNTLPIRRLALSKAMGPADLRMAYVPLDTLEPFADGQRYTAVEDGRLYRYEAADGSFEALLPLDEDGLVTDYPQLFERV